jgi:hypothetical protein
MIRTRGLYPPCLPKPPPLTATATSEVVQNQLNASTERYSVAQTENGAQAEDAALAGGRQPVATA